jgi:SNF2 family DNA or RNA helicase
MRRLVCLFLTKDALITTYETMTSHIQWLRSKAWRLVVLDEGHHIKNEHTMAAQAACSLTAYQRIILTGTPLQVCISLPYPLE